MMWDIGSVQEFNGKIMKLVIILIADIILALLALNCKSDSTGPSQEKYVTGIVKETSGNPVANAFLNISYRLKNKRTGEIIGGELNGQNPDSANVLTSIVFIAQTTSHAHVTLENYLHEYIKTLFDGTVDEGMNEIFFDVKDSLGRTLYSDMYFCGIILTPLDTLSSVTPLTQNIFLLILQHLSKNPSPFAKTDHNGRFTIPLSRLPINEMILYSPNGITDTLLFEDNHLLYAFTTTRYGSTDVSISNLIDHTIILTYSNLHEMNTVLSQTK